MERRYRLPPLALCLLPFALAANPAAADPIAPATLVPALTVYVDSLVRGHAVAGTCAPPGSPARDEAGWTNAKAVLVASLWANGYPADFVADMARRLDSPLPSQSAPDCDSDVVAADFAGAAATGWVAEVGRVIGALDLRPVNHPVPRAKWEELSRIIAGEVSAQAREFECLGALEPGVLPVMIHDWDEMIVKLAGDLVAAGIPHPEIAGLLGGAEANALWKPATTDALPALQKSCLDDKAWSDRLASFRDLGLESGIAHMLPADDPDPQN